MDEYWWNATHRDDVRLSSLQLSRLPGAGCRRSRQLHFRPNRFREDFLVHVHDDWNVLLLLHTAPVDARRDSSSMSRTQPEESLVHLSSRRTNLANSPFWPGFFRYPRPLDDLVFRGLNVKLFSWAFGSFRDLVERLFGSLFEAGSHKLLRKNRNFRKLNIP